MHNDAWLHHGETRMKLPTAKEMQDLDRAASEVYGIPSVVLMENAGVGTVRMIEKELGPCQNTFSLIFIGPGNNGGDGLVIGRHLHQRGCHPVFFFLVNPDTLTGDSAVNLKIIRKLRLPFHVIDNIGRVDTIPLLFKNFEARDLRCYVVVDAIFGVGLSRDVTGHFAETIQLINKPGFAHNAPVVSVDTPSGMDVDTGKFLGCCVQADYTATYCCAKPGHFTNGSSSWTGKLEIIDIGIPPEAIHQAGITTELVTEKVFRNIVAPITRSLDCHKGSNGHLLLLAGSTGKTGAAILAAQGALHSGAGLVSLCVPKKLNAIFETSLIEAMTIVLQHSLEHPDVASIDEIVAATKGKQALVLGPGIGIAKETEALVLELYRQTTCPMIIDADGLNILAENINNLPAPGGPRIFTPHPGELHRLLNKPTQDIQNNRLDAAMLGYQLFENDEHETVFVLKGAGSIIAGKFGSTIINTTGNPGMASGGMGDVLSGIIGSLLCQGLSPLDAAVAGVYLHGAAADILYKNKGVGYLASEVAQMLPFALAG